MKPNLSNPYRNSGNSVPFPKQHYPVNAKVIYLVDHKLKRRPQLKTLPRSKYYIQRNKLQPVAKKSFLKRLKEFVNQDAVIKSLFVCSTVASLLAILFFVGQAISK